jgi:hypothetical protein
MKSDIGVAPHILFLAVMFQTTCILQASASPLDVEYDEQLRSFLVFDRFIPRRDGLGAEIIRLEPGGISTRLGFIKDGDSYELELAMFEREVDRDPKNIAVQTIEIDKDLYESVVLVIERTLLLPRLPFDIRHVPLGGTRHRYSLRDPMNAFHTTSPKGAFLRNLDSLAGTILQWVDTDDLIDKENLCDRVCREADFLAVEAVLKITGDPFH